MKRQIVLLALLCMFCLGAAAQQNPFALIAFPNQISATASKTPGGSVWLTQPITIALPLNTASPRGFQVYTPMNSANYVPVKFAASTAQTPAAIMNGTAAAGALNQVFLQIGTELLTPGSYQVAIFIYDPMTITNSFVLLNLTVIDGHNYNYPDASTKIVPHLASGAGWRTTLQLTNPNSTASAVEIHFFSPDGTPTAFRRADGYSTDVYNEVVNAYGTKSVVLEDPKNKNTLSGSAQVRAVMNGPVNVTILYQALDAAAHEAALPALPATADTLTLFFDNTGGRVTGLALSNSINYEEPVQIAYYDESGNLLVKAAPVILAANGQTAIVVNEPNLAGWRLAENIR